MKGIGYILLVAALLVVGLLAIAKGGEWRVLVGLGMWLAAACLTVYGAVLAVRAVWRKRVRP
jgi:hypothetical protein